MWNRISLKLGAAIMALFLAVLIPLGNVIDQIFSGYYRQSLEQNMEDLSIHYAEMAEKNGNMMAGMIDMMAEMSNVDVLFIDFKGKEIMKSDIFHPPDTAALTEEELRQVLSGELTRLELVNNNGERFLAFTESFEYPGGHVGAVFIFSSVELMRETISQIRTLLVFTGIGSLFIAIGITVIVSRKLSEPLLQMENVAKRMAGGDLDVKVSVNSNDEVGSLAKTINDLAGELKRVRDSRSEFFANISHELRTPITYLQGYANVLNQGLFESEDEKQNYLRIIRQEAERMKHLVDDLFELAKMEEGRLTFNIEWMNLAEPVEAALAKVKPRIESKELVLVKEIQPALPYVLADGIRMEQIMINLLDNAIRYITSKGTISIRLYADPDYVIIVIADTGLGIPEEELPYIFERFYRVEKSRSRERGGTGLGLAIVKKMVEMQDGNIEVFSKIGEGTTFQLKFPIKNEEIEL